MAGTDKTSRRKQWGLATKLVQEGTLRSQFGETSEAVFLNSGYVYENAQEAEARFKGEAVVITVKENMSFGLRMNGHPKAEIESKVAEASC